MPGPDGAVTLLQLRRARIWAAVAEGVLLAVLLLPWLTAAATDGPQDGRTWAWDVLGLPVLPRAAGMLVLVGSAALVCGGTWLLISTRILRRMQEAGAP